jgi:SAM-dependent methyltransferase
MTAPQFQSTFLIEHPLTPIYQRITRGYEAALESWGHSVLYFEYDPWQGFDEALKRLLEIARTKEVEYLFVFDNSSLLKLFLPDFEQFAFELFPFVIFIHHDNIWSSFGGHYLETSRHLLDGWQRIKHKSIHFCIEYSNFIDLRNLGFDRTYAILHGSEFEQGEPPTSYEFNLSFVGHVLPNVNLVTDTYANLPFSHRALSDFWARLVSLDREIEPSAIDYSGYQMGVENSHGVICERSNYQYVISCLSLCFRGELIKRIDKAFPISIVGGDPRYLRGESGDQVISQENISYHTPTQNYKATQSIYSNTKINLNITGIQFDHAIVNRVVDVGSVGGFILTDWKADLGKITSVSEEISYRNIEELNYKIDYYLNHDEERWAIAQQLHEDVQQHCKYEHLVEFILSKIQFPNDDTEPMFVDLGCGIHKPEGFIGVDVAQRPGVDVVADLNQRFPFPDSSIDLLRAFDVIEHLRDRIHTMNEIWRVCKPNAQVEIRVPSTDGRGAFQDPTHISFWNINSFKYYCVEFPAYLELCQSYGFRGTFSIINLEHEAETKDDVIQVRATLKVIKTDNLLVASLINRLKLRQINLLICPDWNSSPEDLHSDITEVIRAITTHPNSHEITLLINQGNFPFLEDSSLTLEEFIFSLLLQLSLNEEIDVASAGIEISLLPPLSHQEYVALSEKITCRLRLPHTEASHFAEQGLSGVPVLGLDGFLTSQS